MIDKILKIIGFIGSICTIIGFILILTNVNDTSKLLFFIITVIVFIIIFTIINIYQQSIFGRVINNKNIYDFTIFTNTFYNTLHNDIIHKFRDLYKNIEILNFKSRNDVIRYIDLKLMPILDKICDIYKQYSKNKYNFACCLKTVIDEDKVTTLCRDSKSMEIRKEYTSEERTIRGNTAFEELFHRNKAYYIKNYINEIDTYQNQTQNYHHYYNCVSVAPIRYYDKNKNSYVVYGFFCIDVLAQKEYVPFNEHNNFQRNLLGIFADSLVCLYSILRYAKINSEE